jgi:uncharacterized membrane protein YidH (DUF202 family)
MPSGDRDLQAVTPADDPTVMPVRSGSYRAGLAELIFLAFALVFCGVYIASTWHLGIRSKAYPLALLVLALALAGYGLWEWCKAPRAWRPEARAPDRAAVQRLLGSGVLVLGLVWTASRVPVTIPLGVYLFLQSWLLGARVIHAILFALAVTLCCYLLFGVALRIPAPS